MCHDNLLFFLFSINFKAAYFFLIAVQEIEIYTGCKIKFYHSVSFNHVLSPAGGFSHFFEDPLFCMIEVNGINFEAVL